MNFVGGGADNLQQAAAHRDDTCIGKSQAKNPRGCGVCLGKNITNPGSQDMRLAGSRPGQYQYRAFNLPDGGALGSIQRFQDGLESRRWRRYIVFAGIQVLQIV